MGSEVMGTTQIPDWRLAETESDWVRTEARPAIKDVELCKAIALNNEVCPLCHDIKQLTLKHNGSTTGLTEWPRMVRCSCYFYRSYYRYMDVLPTRYQNVKLDELRPSKKSFYPLESQAKLYDELRANPQRSLLLLGPAATGKTHISSALYEYFARQKAQHVMKGGSNQQSLWRITAAALMDQCQSYATQRESVDENGVVRRGTEPDITVNKVRAAKKANLTPCLFLEEMDKIKNTDFRLKELFQVINSIYEYQGVLVINTNFTQGHLMAFFGEHWPDTYVRRIMEDGDMVNMHEEKK
jgi:DNA replication protein DnaC